MPVLAFKENILNWILSLKLAVLIPVYIIIF